MLAVVVCVLVVGWITFDVLHDGWWVTADQHASDLMRRTGIRAHFPSKAAVYVFTQFGARGTILVIFVPFVTWVSWKRQTWQPLLRFGVALALLTATVYAFKYGVGRSAPPLHQVHAEGQSYPSGHAPNSVLMWGLAAWVSVEYDMLGWIRRLTGVMRFAGPLATSVAMLLLDYHWLSDLIAGLAMGVILLRVLHMIFQHRLGGWPDAKSAADGDRGGSRDRGVTTPGTADISR